MNPAKKILVVEDDPDLLEIMTYKITQAGFTVIQAHNGKEGLEVALSEHPNLLLLDVMMPEMTGLEMLKALRQDEWGKDVHVFMLTSMNRSKEMSEAINYNVAKYFIKSDMNYENLISEINLYLRST